MRVVYTHQGQYLEYIHATGNCIQGYGHQPGANGDEEKEVESRISADHDSLDRRPPLTTCASLLTVFAIQWRSHTDRGVVRKDVVIRIDEVMRIDDSYDR